MESEMNFKCLVFVFAFLVSHSVYAGNPQFLNFVLKQAHDRGFIQCDAAIKEVFALVDGSDIRTIVQTGLINNGAKIVAIYGNRGDTVYVEAEFLNNGAGCTFTMTTAIQHTVNCASALSRLTAFRRDAETAGVIFARNNGGVQMILMPNGEERCTAIYVRDGRA